MAVNELIDKLKKSVGLFISVESGSSHINGLLKKVDNGTIIVIDNNHTEIIPIEDIIHVSFFPLCYTALEGDSQVSAIKTDDNTVLGSSISVNYAPWFIAITPDGSHAYVSSYYADTVSVIDTANKTINKTISVDSPFGIAITPNGNSAYVANLGNRTVSIINTINNSVSKIIPVGNIPHEIAITPNGNRAYVTNWHAGTVSN